MDNLPKKRQRREGYYRYGEETIIEKQKPSNHSTNTNANIRTKSTPTRVFPNVPGFGPLTRSEIKQDSIEIDKQSGLASDHTDSEEDDDQIKQGGGGGGKSIFRSIRPPCTSESILDKKKLRYYYWAKDPELMQSDLEKYRNCVHHLQQEYALLLNDEGRWDNNVKLTRTDLSNIHHKCTTNIQNLQMENEMLYSLLAREIYGQNHSPVDSLPTQSQLVEDALNELTNYDSQLFSYLKQEWEEKETAQPEPTKNNKRKSSSSNEQDRPKVLAFIPPNTDSSVTPSPRSEEDTIIGIYSKLSTFIENMKKSGVVVNDEREMETRYGRILAQMTDPTDPLCDKLTSSIHSGCFENEREAQFFDKHPYPMDEIRQHFRQYLNPNTALTQTPEIVDAHTTATSAAASDTVASSRSRRRNKQITQRQNQQGTHLQFSALRRTPHSQPLFLTPVSPFEDYYGGILLHGADHQDASHKASLPTVDSLSAVNDIPDSLHQSESLVTRVNQSRACLQRGIRTLSALEKEKIEWTTQLEKFKSMPMKDLLEAEFGIHPLGEKSEALATAPSKSKESSSSGGSKKNNKNRNSNGTPAGVTGVMEETVPSTSLTPAVVSAASTAQELPSETESIKKEEVATGNSKDSKKSSSSSKSKSSSSKKKR